MAYVSAKIASRDTTGTGELNRPVITMLPLGDVEAPAACETMLEAMMAFSSPVVVHCAQQLTFPFSAMARTAVQTQPSIACR